MQKCYTLTPRVKADRQMAMDDCVVFPFPVVSASCIFGQKNLEMIFFLHRTLNFSK